MAEAPHWAVFFSSEEYAAFREMLVADLEHRATEYDSEHLDHGVVRTQHTSYGLLNLARLCKQIDREHWPEAVAEHFDSALSEPSIDLQSATFSEAAPLLKIRLWPSRNVDDKKFVYTELVYGIVVALALDLPEQVLFIGPDVVARWGRDEEELFALGLANVRSEPRLEEKSFELDNGESLSILSGESYFATSHVLFLEEYVEETEHGELIAMPDCHSVIVHCVESAPVGSTMGPLIRWVQEWYREESGALTDQLFWRFGGELRWIACGVRPTGQPWCTFDGNFRKLSDRFEEP